MRPFMRGAWWLPFIFCEGGINASVTGTLSLFPCLSPSCPSCSSLKNGVFLNVPLCRKAANAAELLTGGRAGRFVRQAAKGGSLLAQRSIKKHHRFFRWSGKHIHGGSREEGQDGDRHRSREGPL